MMTTNARRKPTNLQVPAIDDNPAERKRVLNVLAQRRYRRRKKEQVQALEREVRQTIQPASSVEDVGQDFSVQCMSTFSDDLIPGMHSHNAELDTSLGGSSFTISPNDMLVQPSDVSCFDASMFEAVYPAFSTELPSLPSTPSLISPGDSSEDQDSSCWEEQGRNQSSDFSDERNLPMIELNLLRGAMSIAQRLKIDALVFSLESLSPIHNSRPEMYLHLPINLRPTAIQLSRPHHPALDILPWPTVRDKLIMVFSQPVDVRPPIARSATALIDFVYDIEDPAEGIRIWGDDPHSDKNWEVGKKMFQNWWWTLDSDIVNRSNNLRRERGATLLTSDQNRIEELE